MRSSRIRLAGAAFLPMALLVLVSGCSKPSCELAPVSGTVTLDGEPLADAIVSFVPQRKESGETAGPSSVAVTDGKGHFKLKSREDDSLGAVVGHHRVSVSTYVARPVNLAKSDEVEVISEERVPKQYNARSTLSFEVKSGVSNEANWDLSTGSGRPPKG